LRYVFSLLLFAPVASAEPTKEQIQESLAKLHGEWRCSSKEVLRGSGERINEEKLTAEFKNEACEFWTGDDTGEGFAALLVVAKVRVDPSSTPNGIDLTLKWRDKDQKRLGIFKVAGDTLTIRWGQTRPTKFECGDKEGQGSHLTVYKRFKR